MNTVTIISNPFSPAKWEVYSTDDVMHLLHSRLEEWPKNARLYHGKVAVDCDVTPGDEVGVERLGKLTGNFYVVFYPGEGTTAIIVGVVIALLAVVAAVAFAPAVKPVATPAQRNSQSTSPNNELSARSNKARPGGRIPDIFGQVRSTPDLIVAPYSEYIKNVEVEHSVLCVGRGYYEIHDMYDGETACYQVADTSIQAYHPHTDIVSGTPYYTVGAPIQEPPRISVRSNSVNGQKLLPANSKSYQGRGNVVFIWPDIVGLTDDSGQLTSTFRAGDILTISNAVDGDKNLNGTYTIQSASEGRLYLQNTSEVNPTWADLQALPNGATEACSALLTTAGENWIGPFVVEDIEREELWCNVVAMNGLYKDNGRSMWNLAVDVLFEVTPVDKANKPAGRTETFTLTLTGKGRNTAAETLKAKTKSKGRCQIRARRTTPTDTSFEGSVVDEVQWKDLYAMAPLPKTTFGNVTLIRSKVVATAGALAMKERKLNCLVTRQLPLRLEGNQFTQKLYSTTNMADIFTAIAVDPYIGNRALSELDLDNIYDTVDEIEDYFGTSLATDFCYTLDSSNLSYEETAAMVANVGFCTAYRMGNIIRLFFERETNLSSLLFNHRNKIPGTETRTVSFGFSNDNDGVRFEYVSPRDDALVAINIPEDQSAVNAQSVESVGIRNNVQAHFHTMRAWNKQKYQRLSVEFEATQEAELLVAGERILVADNISSACIDGEVLEQRGLELFTTQVLAMKGDYEDRYGEMRPTEYTCFLQLRDGTVQAVPVIKGSAPNSFIMLRPPFLPLVTDEQSYARTTFTLAEESKDAGVAFLVSEKKPQSNYTATLSAVNYDARYYANDRDFINGDIKYTEV